MAYTDEGKGSPILFVHGFPLNGDAWSRQLDTFKATNRVLTPDLPGFGASAPAAGPATMARYAEDLFTLCQHLETGPVVMVGHSMGGYIALAFARAYPLFLRGLVLVGTRAGGDQPDVAEARRETATKVRNGGFEAVVKGLIPKMLSETPSNLGMVQAVRDIMWASSPHGVSSALLALADRPDQRGHLDELRMPTLVVTGAEDMLIPPGESAELARGIRGAELIVIPKAGHLVAYEQPLAFNEALGAWLGALQAHGLGQSPASLVGSPQAPSQGVQP
ncbi:MAG: alpha/beta hydrolase [Geothrix sp.]|uniref:alpha/beta fold hydrolase n=1 Tax=Geothrix sp. TaxID=1962974 RepID=UPI0017CCDD3E|nr:alpha/beta hydrolase [Geothrix sp.]NWJ41022.1 alpha/beta hydrolase [Geothrix sp.]WIL20981.1 MAG: alpha/beta hydrolase [Geothrix sp.]